MSYYSDPPSVVKEKNTRRFVSPTLKTPLSNTKGTTKDSLVDSSMITANDSFSAFQADFHGSHTHPIPHSRGYDDTTRVDLSTTLYGHAPGYIRERESDIDSSLSEHNNLGIRNAHLLNSPYAQYSAHSRSRNMDECKDEGHDVDSSDILPQNSSSRRSSSMNSREKTRSASAPASASASASPLFSSLATIQPATQATTSSLAFEASEIDSTPSPQYASSDPRSIALQAVHVYGVNEVCTYVFLYYSHFLISF